MKIKKGDQVVVIAGKEKGKQGKITRVLTKTDRVVIEGINQSMRHVKPSQTSPEGGRVMKDVAIHASNVMLLDPKTGKPTRIGKKLVKDSKTGKEKSVRFAKASGTLLDQPAS
jgi:large subunit ribosomal protein L24